MSMRPFYLAIALLFSLSAAAQTVTYVESDEDFVNPDRGFYYPIYTTTDPVLDAEVLLGYRNNAFYSDTANYQVRVSLIFRYYVLGNYTDGPIAQGFLDNMQADFEALRTAGMRVIPRFTYNIAPDTSCGEAACPPYGDVPKSRVLQHIAQIKPLLQANADVISMVQLGFIGVWGEGYYTDYFGDASEAGDGKITDANWQKRNDVLEAMLGAVPADRMVQVRYPQLKQRYVYGIDALPGSSPALTAAEAHSGTDKARIGFHNDCFLASPDDYGTYFDYGNDSSVATNAIDDLKPYFSIDGKYVAVGGETCKDEDFSPQNDCTGDGGIAVSEMEYLNYSFLNSAFNNAVNNDWQTQGCMDDIKQRLGYRFVLKNGTYPSQATVGTNLNVIMNFENKGFAAPFNERALQLVLRHTSTGQAFKLLINGNNTDTRFWLPGSTIGLNGSVNLPAIVPAGNYELLLHIADFSNCGAIADRPEYSVRLANQDIWEPNTGFNDLNHVLTVASNANGSGNCVAIDGNYEDWDAVGDLANNGTNGLLAFKAAADSERLFLYAHGNLETNYQLFIDSDNDNSGPNEYLNGTWGSNGFNYMIENDVLYHYTGGGTNWLWDEIDVAIANKSTNKIELSIDKSLFTTFAGTIRLGFSTLDGSWETVGQIPNNNTGSLYTFANQSCASCTTDDIRLDGFVTNAATYTTTAKIEAAQTIFPSAVVTYTAGETVLLQAGFTAKEGAHFTARIESCGASNRHPIRAQSRTIPTTAASEISIYPNPFTDYIDVSLRIDSPGLHALIIYDALGKTVATPFQYQWYEQGVYHYHLPLRTPSQLLIAVLQSDSGQVVKKLVRVE